MGPILHLRKELIDPPVALAVDDVSVRPMAAPDDVDAWLALRTRATAGLTPRVREWMRDDFAAQMLSKPWWRDDCTWLAISYPSSNAVVVGAVTLARRKGAATTAPIVHWLMVDPAWRRRGIGRVLISHLERTAWDAGRRELQLETHVGWSAAVKFYQSIGYAPVRARSPR